MLASLGKDVVVYGLSDFVFKIIAFAVFPIYAHTFSVHEFGVIELVTSLASLLAMGCGLGLNNAVQRFYFDPGITRDKQRSVVSSGLLLQSSLSVVLVIAALVGLYPFRDRIETSYGIPWLVFVLAFVGLIPALILQFVLDVLRLHFSPWRYTAVALLRNVLGVAVGLVLILAFGFGISGVFMGAAAGGLFAIPLGLWMIGRDLRFHFDTEVARCLAQFGYPFVFTGVAYWIFGSLDRWMLAYLSGIEDVGLFGIAFKFAMVAMFLNAAFGQAWSPWAMKIRSERSDYRKVYSQIFSKWFVLLTMVGCLLSIFSKELLQLTTPEPYWPAANIIVVAVLGVVFFGTTQITAIGISIEKQTRLFAISAWIAAAANFMLNILLIPTFGAIGAATATTLTYFGLSAAYLYWTQKIHPLPLHWEQLFSVFLAAVSTVPIALMLNSHESKPSIILIKTLVPAIFMMILWQRGLFRNMSAYFTRSQVGVPDLK